MASACLEEFIHHSGHTVASGFWQRAGIFAAFRRQLSRQSRNTDIPDVEVAMRLLFPMKTAAQRHLQGHLVVVQCLRR